MTPQLEKHRGTQHHIENERCRYGFFGHAATPLNGISSACVSLDIRDVRFENEDRESMRRVRSRMSNGKFEFRPNPFPTRKRTLPVSLNLEKI